MLWEMDISIISGQLALLHVKLEPGDGFEVYGGTSEDGLRVERQGDSEWLVTLDEQDVAGRPLVRYNVYARQLASGREWAILGGKIMVSQRTATVPGDKLAPVEYFVTVPVVENAVDLTGTALVTGIVGPRGYSAYEVAVLEGFEGSEAEWLEWIRQQTATKAVEQVAPFAERAERAASDATEHARQTEQNKLAAGNAAASATASAEAAQQAKADAEAAQQEAAADATAAGNAAASATASAEAAQQAKADAGLSKDGAEMARDGAQVAQGVAEAARDGAQVAQAGAEAARDGAQVAQAGAEAAQVAADDAAGAAAGSADAAVVAAAEAKAAEAGAAGAADAVRFDLLPLVLDWLAGWLRGMLGEGNFTVTQGDARVTVVLELETTAAQVDEVKSMVGRVLPRNLEKVIMWADGLPIDYARLEYIETVNTNDSQFIDTGITATNETSCKIRIAHLEQKTAHVVFAYSTLNKPKLAMMVNSPSGALPVFQYGNQATGYGDYKKALVEGKWYSVENKKNEFFIDGNFIKSLEEEEFETSLPIYLFVGNANKPVGRGLVRCSEFEVWEGETKVAHFIPALLRETKTPCMFDLISKQPKWNLGEGDFTYPGHEMEQATYSLRDRKYGKWTENGIWRLNCVPEGYSSKAEYAAEHGFKVLIETPVPGEGSWAPVWHDREDCIELEWVETEAPTEEETLTETE